MSTIVTHLGQNIKWVASKIAHNTFTITLTESSVAYDLSDLVLSLVIRKRNSQTALLTLTEGSGIVNGGATGIITITLTEAQANTTLSGVDFFWQLMYEDADGFNHNMFQGALQLVLDNNPESTTSSLAATVQIGSSNVSAALTIMSAFGNSNIDGGSASSTYLADQNLDGGGA